MLLIRTILKNVKSFVAKNNRLIYSNKYEVIEYPISHPIYSSREGLQELHLKKGIYYINSIEGGGVLFNDEFKKEVRFVQTISPPLYLSFDRTDNGKQAVLRKINDDSLSHSFEGSSTIFLLEDNCYYRYNKDANSIERFQYQFNSFWGYDLLLNGTYFNRKGGEEKYSVEKFLGIWQNELLIACSNSLILSLNIETGQEVRRWQQLEGYYSDIKGVANQLPRTQYFVFDEENQKLFALHICSLVIIDLSSGEIQIADIEPSLKEAMPYRCSFNSHRSYGLSTTHIFTTVHLTDDQSESTYDAVVAINRRTLSIDWKYQFEKDGVGTNAPIFDSGKLYQLTLNHNLYIFEQENMR